MIELDPRCQTRKPRGSIPDLVSNDGDSSSDESSVVGPIDVADDDSGVLGIQPESEGEMWADHPTIDPNVPENLEPPPSPARPVSPPTPHTVPPDLPSQPSVQQPSLPSVGDINLGDDESNEPVARRTRSNTHPQSQRESPPRENEPQIGRAHV